MNKIKMKKSILLFSLILGFSIILLLVFLLLLFHLNQIRNKHIFSNLQKDSSYEIIVNKKSNCENTKYNLGKTKTQEYFGYCISNVYVFYKGSKITLQESLQKKYITLEDIIMKMTKLEKKNGFLFYSHADEMFSMTIIPTYGEQKEIIFSPLN